MPVDVGAVEDFSEGVFRLVNVYGREVGVTLWRGCFYALRNTCPHQAGPLCAGRVLPSMTAAEGTGTRETDASAPVIACPWHGWEFSLADGRSVWSTKYRVRAYEVMVRDGRVLLEMSR
ncbi:MAG TPA: Rieske 2Fe-2S domain-containing protein [Chloroflexota bacterium]